MVESPLAGVWRASEYTSAGCRVEHELNLVADGQCIWRVDTQDHDKAEFRGQWWHDQAKGLLRLSPANPLPEGLTQMWSVLDIAGLEPGNTFVVLRRVALASRNLPVLFYRVHPGD